MTETVATASQAVRELKAEKRKLKKEFFDHVGNKKKAKERIVDYYDKENNKSDDESSVIDSVQDSQESLLNEIYNLDYEIREQSASLKKIRTTLAEK